MKSNTKLGTLFIICATIPLIQPCNAELNRIDAYITLSDYVPPAVWTTPPEALEKPELSNLEKLRIFLANDSTNHHEYIPSGCDMYTCVHFATDLTQNLTNARFPTGIVVKSAKYHNRGCGHMLSFVKMNSDLFVVESINDDIYWSEDYNNSIDTEIYVTRYESLESGHRKRSEMERRNR